MPRKPVRDWFVSTEAAAMIGVSKARLNVMVRTGLFPNTETPRGINLLYRADIERVKKAITLAQQTPSACNRQGWRTIIIDDKDTIKKVLENQNGNEGFGQEFDKLLLVVTDLRYFNKNRELFQPYIDGGMYAQSVLYALHFEHIAACPLSASLKREQEEHIRSILRLPEAEVPILLIGIGNYPEDKCQTTRSERKEPDIQVI